VYGSEERVVETLEQKGGQLGYSLVGVDGYGGRASSYGFLHSSRSGGLFYRNLERDGNVELEGNFLNEHDYHGDLLIDYRGDYRLHLRTESLYHNLDRELLFSQSFTSGRADLPGQPASYRAFQDPPTNYGVSVTQDVAEFRYRLHNYPLHLNLGYWRLVREGTQQQRFADTAFEGPENRIFAQARGVNQQTQEGRLGLDAHLAWVDLIYEFRVRAFEDRLPTPTGVPDPANGSYLSRNNASGNPETVGGAWQHNENPDSTFVSHTVKLHTSLSGGIVGSASYSIDERENLSRLSEVSGIKHATTTLQNAAGDFVYTPCKEFSLAVKYRRQELDNGNRGTLTSVNFVNPVQTVKPPVNSTKDIVLVNLSFRPAAGLSLTAEYRGQVQKREQVSDIPSAGTWALPETTSTQRGALAVLYHPVKGFRVTGKYSYDTTDHPAYGTSFEQRHEGQFLASYTAGRWGASANLTARHESNDNIEHFLVNFPFTDPASYTVAPLVARDRGTENSSLSFWVAPFESLTLSGNYAWLHTSVNQGVMFTGVGVPSTAGANFTTRSQVYGVNAAYEASQALNLSLALQQIRSKSAFSPDELTFSPGNSSAGIRDLTRQDTVISSASARGEYRFTPQFSAALQYSVQDYNEKNPVLQGYDGTVQTVVAYLTGKW
jgi:hypothetical protein